MQDPVAIIVGAGPSGLATSACLNQHSIPHIILEREDCFASLWKKYSYDRLHLHLKKQFCELPHMPFPASSPTYIPKDHFIKYLDHYVSHFKISPIYQRCVESASYDEATKKWKVMVRNVSSSETEEYSARFLVVASGEACNPFIPEVEGLNSFTGDALHSTQFGNGKAYRDKNVLVVGSGNSGMEIALDLANHGARTSIVVRSPVHILSREMVHLGLVMLKYFSLGIVDSLMVLFSKFVYGDLTNYGMRRATEGPFFMKVAYGKYPIFDVGTFDKIKAGEIQVLPAIQNIRGNEVLFENGRSHSFDAIIFCTGFKRSTNKWLKGDDYLLNEDGIPKPRYPNHWKGKKGLYCIGLSRRGLYGASADAQNTSDDIKSLV
ncbi:probable indole-3-pyruvate monooxygenase YUCCA10 [Hevea brasiliensis]|uniref:probable indole-3-pyruvate monooxygenase YUCCA10 n=1 Tax=Hevea brasiliensis TaxID=3981 RepID=UPI0025F082E9|nr:probable indole-3-pyruvate monooxygenase YUCCA10 [Hevea brasiliensis]